jgi:type II secretory pathway predicted ATPase ExeA
MRSSELGFFGLRTAPFSKELDDAELWLPTSKQVLVDDLEAALLERASVLLVGEPGVGKTCVLRALRHRLPQAGFRLTYCHNATLGRRDFYRYLCHALGLQPTSSAASLFLAVERHVHELRRDQVHPVFLLDEAHLLHPDMMAHLHILLNHEWDSRALLSIILVGLPELEGRMALRSHRSLLTRIHHRFMIEPATVEDTAEYVAFRLKGAGADHELFSGESLAALHELASGSLREIDRLASAAMRESARRKRKLVDRDAVARVAETLTLSSSLG